MNLIELARMLNAFERVDKSDFQRRARIMQSLWREEQGIPSGEHHGRDGLRLLGSRLPMPEAELQLQNFLNDTIRDVVRKEVLDPKRSAGKLYARPRIFNDLLSSQPLCFNLFGELSLDLDLASKVMQHLTSGRIEKVSSIEFEMSPGRRNPKYLDDRSAFDVFVRCSNHEGAPCFVGIEVKYHENLVGNASEHKSRYDEVADLMGCFHEDLRPFRSSPLQQIWRDHLLAGITLLQDGYADALFIMLHPRENEHVAAALRDYKTLLTHPDSFTSWTLEACISAVRRFSDAAWISQFEDRYLAFEKINKKLGLCY